MNHLGDRSCIGDPEQVLPVVVAGSCPLSHSDLRGLYTTSIQTTHNTDLHQNTDLRLAEGGTCPLHQYQLGACLRAPYVLQTDVTLNSSYRRHGLPNLSTSLHACLSSDLDGASRCLSFINCQEAKKQFEGPL